MVSVIIPTYNSEQTIAACLNSVKVQKYLKEIIVVDNFSKDQTVKIAKKITPLVFQIGPERSAQRNFGMQKAKAEWFFFVDSDQILSVNCLKDTIDSAKQNHLDAVIIYELVKGNSYWSKCLNLEKQIYHEEYVNSQRTHGQSYTHSGSVLAPRLIKKATLLKIGAFDEKLIAGEDWDLHERLTDVGANIGISKSPIRRKTLFIRRKGSLIRRKGPLIYNLEQNASFASILKKKYYYAKNIKNYVQKHPGEFNIQAGFARFTTLFKQPKIILQNPSIFCGLIVLKFAQYLAYLLVKIKSDP